MSSAVEPLTDRDVRRLDRKLAAWQFAILGGIAFVIGVMWSMEAVAVQTRGEWFSLDLGTGFVLGAFVSAVGMHAFVVSVNIALASGGTD